MENKWLVKTLSCKTGKVVAEHYTDCELRAMELVKLYGQRKDVVVHVVKLDGILETLLP